MFRCVLAVCLAGACCPGRAVAEDVPRRLLLIGQEPDQHPPGTHEYRAAMRVLAACLSGTPGLETRLVDASGPWTAGPEILAQADGAVLFVSEGARWLQADPRRHQAFQRLAARGGGLAVLHWGMGCRDAEFIAGFRDLFGGCHGGPDRKFQVVETELTCPLPDHPVAAGWRNFSVRDEFYYRLKLTALPGVEPLLVARIDGRNETVAWVWQRRPAEAEGPAARSFGFSGLHFHALWEREEYRRLVAQAAIWIVRLPVPEGGLKVDVPAAALALPGPPPPADSRGT